MGETAERLGQWGSPAASGSFKTFYGGMVGRGTARRDLVAARIPRATRAWTAGPRSQTSFPDLVTSYPAATSTTAAAQRARPTAWPRCTFSRRTSAASSTVNAG